MPYTFTQAWREAVASVDSTVAFIETISLSHPTFPSAYRYSKSDTDLIIGGVTYIGKQFQSSLPELSSTNGGGIQVNVSNVTSQIFNIFRNAVNTGIPILLEPKYFVANQPLATASFATKLFVKTVGFDKSDMIMQAGYPDTTNKKLPAEKYTTRECPGLRG